MFKRLLAALRGKPAEPARPAAPVRPPDEELITVYDGDGRELCIARGEWRDRMLLPNVQRNWDNAPELYRLILSGVNDGFAADLVPAAARLVEIDDMPERAHVTQGIVLMNGGQPDAAQATLEAGIERCGASAVLLTNLAKALDLRGEHAQAEATLWRAVQADPNLENATMWWAAIQRERDGDGAYVDALRKVAALPGSWRAQLWLGRDHLERGEVDAAQALFAGVLAAGTYDAGALTTISGELGSRGHLELLVVLVAPVYDVRRHEPMTGLNLLRSYQALGRVDEGETLLKRLYALDLPPLKGHLDQFARAFQASRVRR
jgi:tetratricopeptide (TPR) repeat protein